MARSSRNSEFACTSPRWKPALAIPEKALELPVPIHTCVCIGIVPERSCNGLVKVPTFESEVCTRLVHRIHLVLYILRTPNTFTQPGFHSVKAMYKVTSTHMSLIASPFTEVCICIRLVLCVSSTPRLPHLSTPAGIPLKIAGQVCNSEIRSHKGLSKTPTWSSCGDGQQTLYGRPPKASETSVYRGHTRGRNFRRYHIESSNIACAFTSERHIGTFATVKAECHDIKPTAVSKTPSRHPLTL